MKTVKHFIYQGENFFLEGDEQLIKEWWGVYIQTEFPEKLFSEAELVEIDCNNKRIGNYNF